MAGVVFGFVMLAGLGTALGLDATGDLVLPCDVYGKTNDMTCDGDNVRTGCNANTYGAFCLAGGGTCTACTGAGAATDGGGAAQCAAADDACHCNPGYTGNDCNTEMIAVSCTATEMTIVLTPYQTLGGNYLEHVVHVGPTNNINLETNTCKDVDSGPTAFSAFPYAAPASGDCQFGITADGDGFYILYLYLQHISSHYLRSDQLYEVKCKPDAGEGSATGDTTIAVLATDTLTEVTSSTDTGGGFTMSLKANQDGSTPIPADIALATDLYMMIEYDGGTEFSVIDCQASSSVDFSSADTFFFLADVCVPYPAQGLYGAAVEYISDGTTVGGAAGSTAYRFHMLAWRMALGGTLYIECDMCSSPDCFDQTGVDCASSPDATLTADILAQETAMSSSRRRRRAALPTTINSTSLSVGVRVSETGLTVTVDSDGSSSSSDSDSTSCYSSTSVLLPIILLAVLLLVAMVMTFFFCIKVTQAKEHAGGLAHDNTAYKS